MVCRVFKKRTATTMRRMNDHESPYWYDDQVSLMSDLDSPQQPPSQSNNNNTIINYSSYTYKKELNHHHINHNNHSHSHNHGHRLPFQIPQEQAHLMQYPLFENSKMLLGPSSHGNSNSALVHYNLDMNLHSSLDVNVQHIDNNNHNNASTLLIENNNGDEQDVLDQVTDWRVLDKFVASQLSQEDVAKCGNDNNNNNNNNKYSSSDQIFHCTPISDHSIKEDSLQDKASTPTSTSEIDVWK